MLSLVKPVYAASVDLGQGITGVGVFQNSSIKAQTTGQFISAIIGTLTVVGGLAFVIYFTLGAFKWIISGGDKTKTQEAQSTMTQAAIGLIAIVAAYFIIGIVGGVLGLDILNPVKVLFPSTP